MRIILSIFQLPKPIEAILEIILKTLVQIHVEMIHMDPEFGLINNLQLLTQKLRFRLVKASQKVSNLHSIFLL